MCTAPFPPQRSGAPPWGFIAHMDTYGGVSGENIHPQVIENYDGGAIALGGSGLSLSPAAEPALLGHVGKTLITTDGTTLLGGDDKAGVAEILVAAEEILRENKPHGTVKIGFTPDEEIGEGADHFDVEGFGCDYAYTVDGGQLGGLDYETFNAASAVVEVEGVSTHTGGAKGKDGQLHGRCHGILRPAAQRPGARAHRGPGGLYPPGRHPRQCGAHRDAVSHPGPRQGAVPPEEGTDGESRRLYQRQVPHPALWP